MVVIGGGEVLSQLSAFLASTRTCVQSSCEKSGYVVCVCNPALEGKDGRPVGFSGQLV